MTRLSNEALCNRFVRGDAGDGYQANRMAVEVREDCSLLWGYGHALYGARFGDDGPCYVYNGWYGRSRTTSKHLNVLADAARNVYADEHDAGDQIRVTVDGEGNGEVLAEPPTGRCVVRVEDSDPGTNYGRFDAGGRPELSDLDGEMLHAPSGYGD